MPKKVVKQFKDFIGEIHSSDFSTMEHFKTSAAAMWLGVILFGVAITWLTSFSVSNFPEHIEAGMVIRRDIRADKRISVVNEEETAADRQNAAESVLPIFDYNGEIPEGAPVDLRTILGKPIVADADVLAPHKNTGIVLRRIVSVADNPKKEQEFVVKDFNEIWTVAKAKARVKPAAQKWIVPNATFNLKETEQLKEAAIRSVKEKTATYQPGDFILRAGTKVEPQHVALLERVQKARGLENRWPRFLGTFLFVILALGATFYFSERFVKRFQPEKKDYLLMGFVSISILILLRTSMLLFGVLHEAFFYNIPLSAMYYAVPIAGGVMLVRMVLTAEVSLVLAIILSLLAGLTVGNDVNFTTYCLISCIAAGSAIVRADSRVAIMKAGFWTGLVNAIAVLGVQVIQVSAAQDPFAWQSIFGHIGFAFCGGLFASTFVFLMAPLMEYFLDYTTDIKLLELANLNHPLLKELIFRAPGTYHHSHIVGVLAEAGAEAIGANSLLARVSAYYHDIGKMKKPGYFIENSLDAVKRHDSLSPHMSALIIAAHVKEGIQLARSHKLPEAIVDMIPQHHGTKRIGYFYERALEQEGGNQKVEEKDFVYPGPKPQSREAGVLMLADGAEAMVRSLKEKSSARIKQTVEQLIDKSFAEAQLDDCDLTLKDLHEIAKVFTRILTALHHQRVEYDKEKDSADPATSAKKAASEEALKISPENVHRIKFPGGE